MDADARVARDDENVAGGINYAGDATPRVYFQATTDEIRASARSKGR